MATTTTLHAWYSVHFRCFAANERVSERVNVYVIALKNRIEAMAIEHSHCQAYALR